MYAATMNTISDNPTLASQFDASNSFTPLSPVPPIGNIKTKSCLGQTRSAFAVCELQGVAGQVKQ
jgi:hypothetical protein